jgi:predicted enzyme related to lactoylglutathione lyase
MLCQLEIYVTDLILSTTFYTTLLGWCEAPVDMYDTVMFITPPQSGYGLSLRTRQKSLTAQPAPESGIIPYFKVSTLEGLAELCAQLGGKWLGSSQKLPSFGTVCYLEDPDQNKIGVFVASTAPRNY